MLWLVNIHVKSLLLNSLKAKTGFYRMATLAFSELKRTASNNLLNLFLYDSVLWYIIGDIIPIFLRVWFIPIICPIICDKVRLSNNVEVAAVLEIKTNVRLRLWYIFERTGAVPYFHVLLNVTSEIGNQNGLKFSFRLRFFQN